MLSLLVILTACAPEREEVKEVAKESSGETAKPEKLVVWVNDEDIAADVSKQMFDKYTEKTGIEIVMERVPQPDQIQELALAGPAGDGPDLFFQPQDRLGDVVAQGLAVPFDYTSAELEGISEAAIDAFTYEGDVYGAPVAIETYFVYYNKSIIETAPTTIEEVFEMSKEKTNKAKDEYGFLISPSFYYLYPFINSYGGYVFAEENGTYDPEDVGLNNEGAIEGLTQYQSFVKAGLLPKTLTVDVLDGLFTEGKVGMVVSGPWNLPVYAEALGDNLATAPLPQINGEIAQSFVGVKSWLTSYYSKNQEWAQDLAKFLMNEENSQLYYDVTGELPPRQSILDKIDDPIYAGYTEQIKYGTPMPNIPEMSAVWDIDDAIELIVGGEDVQGILDESVQNIKEKIEISK
ncbi:extracellular solute-binding protein [Sporosarcina sp. ANT_H38]|nr:extracellular solute-binding protein [Sporosarcina sp. ANT_H38]KAA0967059.1 extracellular solute-binding protein [Sporosarcina sp. ANT_H38]